MSIDLGAGKGKALTSDGKQSAISRRSVTWAVRDIGSPRRAMQFSQVAKRYQWRPHYNRRTSLSSVADRRRNSDDLRYNFGRAWMSHLSWPQVRRIDYEGIGKSYFECCASSRYGYLVVSGERRHDGPNHSIESALP